MGLRLVAHYFERSEAFVARSVIEAAGMLAFLHNEDWIRLYPQYVGAFGGYRLMVSELDLESAVAVLTEARLSPLLEGERLEVRGGVSDRVASFALGWVIVVFPYQSGRHDGSPSIRALSDCFQPSQDCSRRLRSVHG